MRHLVVITHPEVIVDPQRAVTDWALSPVGQRRARAFARSGSAFAQVSHIVCSTERKAVDTARILAAPRALPVSLDAALGENDREATGFLPPPEFEAAADAFFAHPDHSFRGWERAVDAQARIVGATRRAIAAHPSGAGDLALVTHGAVGTLLYCALSGLAIDRRHDQPGQGHYWSAPLNTPVPIHGWRRIA